jgi:hypothetical protein
VDDILYCAESELELSRLDERIQKHFKVKIQLKVTKFVGLVIEGGEQETKVHRRSYVEKVIGTFELLDPKICSVPIQINTDFEEGTGDKLEDNRVNQALL